MTWTLSRRTIVGLGLVALVAVITQLIGMHWTSGYLCGFIHAWLLGLYTARWAIHKQSVEATLGVFRSS